MKIAFKKIPRLALAFYLLGLLFLSIAVVNYLSEAPFIEDILMQQIFIVGAVIVTLGSVFNTLFQFKK